MKIVQRVPVKIVIDKGLDADYPLPHVVGSLSASYDESTWVLTSYLVANGIVLPISVFLSRLFGRKLFFINIPVGILTVRVVYPLLESAMGEKGQRESEHRQDGHRSDCAGPWLPAGEARSRRRRRLVPLELHRYFYGADAHWHCWGDLLASQRPQTGIPSTLARRRPDVREAEAYLHAATAQIGVPVAELFPSLMLNGQFGLRNTRLPDAIWCR